jgi:uracil-DNA glycosylase
MLLNKSRSNTWDELLTKEILQQLDDIESQIGDDYTPMASQILRFMNQDLDKIKICIIGQDPYFSVANGDLVANGRSFQPSNLMSWSEKFRQVSLKNMIRLIHKTYNDIEKYEEIYKYKEITHDIENGTFAIKQPREWFDSMEEQGVLFLNRYLTTKLGTANAHQKIWDDFMKSVIAFIGAKRPDMIWFLWGKEAISCMEIVGNGIFYTSRHPMMCSNKYDEDFLKAECFLKTKDIVHWLG